MAFAARKDESGIDTFLHVGSERCLNIGGFCVFRYLLKFVNTYNTRFICLSQIFENLIEGSFRVLNIT